MKDMNDTTRGMRALACALCCALGTSPIARGDSLDDLLVLIPADVVAVAESG